MKNTHSLFLLALAALTGCGDCDGGESPEGGGPEGGAPVGGDGGGTTVDLEKPDAGIDNCHADFMEDGVCRPSIEKCAPGTIPDIDEGCVAVGVPSCAPEFLDARGVCLPTEDACGAGTFPVPSLGCVPIDGEAGCGTGKWGNVVEAADDVHVDGSYLLDDSDGTREKPFAAIAAALAAAVDGNRIVIAEGSYQGSVLIERPLRIQGVCASKVSLVAVEPDPGVMAIFLEKGEVVRVQGVSMQSETTGVYVEGGHVDFENVHIHDVDIGIGVAAAGVITVTRSLVEDISNGSSAGDGISAFDDGRAEVSESAVIRARTAGLGASSGGTLVATDVFVDSTLPDSGTYALSAANNGGDLLIESSVFTRSGQGIGSYSNGTSVIRNSVVAATTDPAYGDLVSLEGGASVEASGNVLIDGSSSGIFQYAGALQSSHNWIAHLSGGDYGNTGIGQSLPVGSDATLTSEGDVVTDVGMAGMWVLVDATVTGAVIEGVEYQDILGIAVGGGILIGDGGATVSRSYVSEAADYGILVATTFDPPTSVVITNTRIESIAGVDGNQGMAIGATGSKVSLEIDGVSIADVHGAGIVLHGASAEARNTLVSGVADSMIAHPGNDEAGPEAAGPAAIGLLFYGGGPSNRVSLVDCWFDGYGRNGVVLSGGEHELERVRALGGQVGLVLQDAAVADATDCDFSGNSEADESTEAVVALPP